MEPGVRCVGEITREVLLHPFEDRISTGWPIDGHVRTDAESAEQPERATPFVAPEPRLRRKRHRRLDHLAIPQKSVVLARDTKRRPWISHGLER